MNFPDKEILGKLIAKTLAFLQMPELSMVFQYCHNCTGSVDNRMKTYDPEDMSLDAKIKDYNKTHINGPHYDFDRPFQVHLVFFQNGHLPGLQFVVKLSRNGYLTVTEVIGNMDINVGDILVSFNGFEMRGKDEEYYESKVKNCHNFTLCKAVFLTPPFPPALLDTKNKVR